MRRLARWIAAPLIASLAMPAGALLPAQVARLSARGVIAPKAAGYLTTTANLAAGYGAQRIVANYAGPLYRLRRTSDGATLDVAPLPGGDYPDYAAIATWMGSSGATIAILYDQSGNGRHMTQATTASQPSFDPTQRYGNVVPILIDGYGRGNAVQPTIAKTLSIGGLGMDLVASSVFLTVASRLSQNSQGYVQGTDDGGTTGVEELLLFSNSNSNVGGVSLKSGGAIVSPSGDSPPRASIDTIGYSIGPSAQYLYQKRSNFGGASTRSSTAVPRITLGVSASGGTTYNGMYRLFGLAVYAATLSNAGDGPAVQAQLNAAFAVPTAYDYTLLLTGDSIQEGSGGLLLRNMESWLREGLVHNAEVYNTAVHGQTLATDYATRTKAAPLYSAARPDVVFIEGGTNDLGNGGSNTDATLWTTTQNLITYYKGLGYKVVVCTLLPRAGSAGWTAQMETYRTSYNATVRSGAAGAGADYVLDLAANPVMGDATSNGDTTLWVDKLHPTALGYRWLAGAPGGGFSGTYNYYYALQQVLRNATGNSGYAP